MHFDLAYGDGHLSFEIDSRHLLGLLEPGAGKTEVKVGELMRKAMLHPLNSVPFAEVMQGASDVLIVVPDKTRNCGAGQLLPLVLEQLNNAGIPDRQMRLLFATGSHAAQTRQEMERIVGPEIMARIEVLQHDSKNDEGLRRAGETKAGIPVHVNREVVESSRCVVMATAVHHYFAGFGGGWKMINPGCAGYETIRRNHALAIDKDAGGIHSQCRSGVIDGNPVQEDLLDSIRFVKVDFLFESVLNAQGDIVELIGGELRATHRQACDYVNELYRVRIDKPADLVLASCGGFPKDINLIQAHKTLYNAYQAVKPGGVIVLLAECRDGIGSTTFLPWFDFPDRQKMLEGLHEHFQINGTTALSLRTKAEEAHIILVSGLPSEVVRKLSLLPATTPAEAWACAKKFLPSDFTAYVLPNGSLTLPWLNPCEG